MEDSKKIFSPRQLTFNNYIYFFKDTITNDYYTYRYKIRSISNVGIKINKENLIKYNENPINEEIEFFYTSKNQTHKCNENKGAEKNENKIYKSKDIKIDIKNTKELMKSLIFANLDKKLPFHIANIKNNCINIKKNSINNYLQKYRESAYPSDKKFIKDITKIVITYDEGNINMTNMSFCYNHTNFLNFKNKNKQDQFIIFTSECQLNLISKCSQILIDGTFK